MRIAGKLPKGASTGPGFVFGYILPFQLAVKGTSTKYRTVRIAVTEETPYENDIGVLYSAFKACQKDWDKSTPKGYRPLMLPNKDTLGMDPKKMRWQQFVEKIREDRSLEADKKRFSDLVFVYWTRNNRNCDQDILLSFLPRIPHHYLQAITGCLEIGENQVTLLDNTQIDNLRTSFESHRVTNCYTVIKICKLHLVVLQLSNGVNTEDDVPVFLPHTKISRQESFDTAPSSIRM